MAEAYTKGGRAAYKITNAQGQEQRLVLAWSPGDPQVDLVAHGVPAGTAAEAGSDDPTQNLAAPPNPEDRQAQLQERVRERVAHYRQQEAERAFMRAYEEWVLAGSQGPQPLLSDFAPSSEPPPAI